MLLSRPFASKSLYCSAETKNFALWTSTMHPPAKRQIKSMIEETGLPLSELSNDYHYKLSQKRCNPYSVTSGWFSRGSFNNSPRIRSASHN